jgi:hypothetical protein
MCRLLLTASLLSSSVAAIETFRVGPIDLPATPV